MKAYNHILPSLLLVPEWPYLPLNLQRVRNLYKKVNAILQKMLNLGFRNFFLMIIVFLVATLFLYLCLSV